jgi:pyrroline-5-carboxylate reductase
MKTVLLAGCGKMGTAMLTGWLERLDEDLGFVVVDPVLAENHPLGSHVRVTMMASLPDDFPAPDMVVLAVKPQVMAEALPPLVAISNAETVWLSIAAGISIDWLRGAISDNAAIIRTMPNTPAAIGRGITAMITADAVSKEMQELARRMLGVVGAVVDLDDEADMDAVTAVSGSGPAYVFLLCEALEAAGVSAGLKPELAAVLAGETVAGAAALLDASKETADQLRVNVTSPGGTTEAALEVLMGKKGMHSILEHAVITARDRSRALGN